MKVSDKAKLGAEELQAITDRAFIGYNNALVLEMELDNTKAFLELARSLLEETLRLYPKITPANRIKKLLEALK